MAVAQTGAIFKTLEFDGENSGNYGVYISGEAVFNAPERDVEMITIPNRNGSFALDNGRFENIEVTYPAGIFADNETDFAQAISDFRNFLCSKRGYCRLTDDYNPDEYRMAIYKSGLEVTPAQLKAGEFEITFECKPQRFLTSGETAITVTSGDTITNPTLFDALPMLEITGYGEFEINGETLEIVAGPIGMVTVKPSQDVVGPSKTFEFDDNYANQGDDIMPIINYSAKYSANIIVPSTENVVSATVQSVPSTWNANCTRSGTNTVAYNITTPRLVFDYGTSKTNSATVQFSVRVYLPDSSGYATRTVSISCEYAYDGQNTITVSQTLLSPPTYSMGSSGIYIASLQLDSSQSALGSPVYFDLDIGEAYKIENDVPVSVNNSVVMPPELPVLPKGVSVITFPNTITDFKIIPRWWKL